MRGDPATVRRPRRLRVAVVSTAATMPVLLVAWLLSLHGTLGLFHASWLAQLLFIAIAGMGLAVALAGIIDARRRRTQAGGWGGLPSYLWIMCGLAIAVPLVIFGYLGLSPLVRVGDKPPLLLVADGSGVNGIPDMAVVFWTKDPTRNQLRWGPGGEVRVMTEPVASQQHAFMLRDLVPGGEYQYQVNDGPTRRLRMPPARGPFRFAVSADSHFGSQYARNDITMRMFEQIGRAGDIRLFFSLGDIVDRGYNDAMWKQALDAYAAGLAQIPLVTAPGNHDTMLGGLRLYEDYFTPQGMDLKTGSRLWKRLDFGDIHFLMMDIEWQLEYGTEQIAWLERQLVSIPRDHWTLVMGHGVYYASGFVEWGAMRWDDRDAIEKVAGLFERYRVPLVFSGHNHHPEFLQFNGVSYAITGPFGGEPDRDLVHISPASVWRVTGLRSFVDVTVDGDRAQLVFRGEDFQELKSFTVRR